MVENRNDAQFGCALAKALAVAAALAATGAVAAEPAGRVNLGATKLHFDPRWSALCGRELCSIGAMLPDLRPVTPETRRAFDDNGPESSKFQLFLSDSPRYLYKDRAAMYRDYVARGIIEARGEDTAFGLRRHRALTRGHAGLEFYSGTTTNGNFLFLQCMLADGLPAPQCETGYLWKDGVSVKYVYKRRHLPEAAAIHDKVEALLESFAN